MWKKIIVAVLVITVAAAGVMALMEVQGKAVAADAAVAAAAPVATGQPAGAGPNAQAHGQQGQNVGGAAAGQQLNQSVDNVGEPWSATGTIVELGDVGMTLALEDGSQVYVELGPATYWQAQGALAAGDVIGVEGFYNGDQYHAAAINIAGGATMALRAETGQPLWAGGASNGSHSAGSTGQVQVAPEDWVSIEGSITAVNRNGLTIETADSEFMVLSFGRADFWQSQGVQFAAGDAIEVRGFWQDGQFQTGQLTKIATGERLLLRDPNGRPLWGGPGRQGGRGGQAQAPATTNG